MAILVIRYESKDFFKYELYTTRYAFSATLYAILYFLAEKMLSLFCLKTNSHNVIKSIKPLQSDESAHE